MLREKDEMLVFSPLPILFLKGIFLLEIIICMRGKMLMSQAVSNNFLRSSAFQSY